MNRDIIMSKSQGRLTYTALLLSILSMQSAWAGSVGAIAPTETPFSGWVATVSAGPAWESSGQAQTIQLLPLIVDRYTAFHETRTILDGEFFFGMQRALSTRFQGQLGVAVAATSNAGLAGEVWQNANPEFNNFIYGYQVRQTQVAVKGKLLANEMTRCALKPYISASLGAGFNQAHSYTSEALIAGPVPAPNFTSNGTTAFTYTVGIGVQRAFARHWEAGVGYQFADWGKSELGRAPGQTMNSGLVLNHLYTNGLMFNLTYLV